MAKISWFIPRQQAEDLQLGLTAAGKYSTALVWPLGSAIIAAAGGTSDVVHADQSRLLHLRPLPECPTLLRPELFAGFHPRRVPIGHLRHPAGVVAARQGGLAGTNNLPRRPGWSSRVFAAVRSADHRDRRGWRRERPALASRSENRDAASADRPPRGNAPVRRLVARREIDRVHVERA